MHLYYCLVQLFAEAPFVVVAGAVEVEVGVVDEEVHRDIGVDLQCQLNDVLLVHVEWDLALDLQEDVSTVVLDQAVLLKCWFIVTYTRLLLRIGESENKLVIFHLHTLVLYYLFPIHLKFQMKTLHFCVNFIFFKILTLYIFMYVLNLVWTSSIYWKPASNHYICHFKY